MMRSLRIARNHLKWFWQRRTRGWDDRDLWSLDYTLAKWLLPRLVAFRARPLGCPSMCIERGDGPDGDEPFDRSLARWHAILDEMIGGFAAIDEWSAESEKRVARSWELLGKYAQCLWN
jgi:hypothetical protein